MLKAVSFLMMLRPAFLFSTILLDIPVVYAHIFFIWILNFFEQHAVTALAKTKRHSFTKSEKELVMMHAHAPPVSLLIINH